jgi:membrane-bound serine protease (ClpP class)
MLLILGIVLLLVLPDPWGLVALVVCVALFLGELYAWNRTVRHKPKVVGAQTLVGRTGEVRETCRPDGQVFVAGELWQAHCADGADAGSTVQVAAVRGLILDVTPVR